jgi:hypothetical protein
VEPALAPLYEESRVFASRAKTSARPTRRRAQVADHVVGDNSAPDDLRRARDHPVLVNAPFKAADR